MVTKRKQIVKKKKNFKNFEYWPYWEFNQLCLISEKSFLFFLFFQISPSFHIYISWILIHLTVQVRCVGREILVNHANENGIHFPIMDTLESSEVFRDNKRKTDTKAINQTIYILQIHYISWNVKKSRGIKPIQVENVPLSCNKAGKKTVITQ